MSKGLTKKANDLTELAPKWSERGHLLAALPKHLAETQEAIKTQQNIDKEMTDLALIASAWMKSQQQKELLEARLKRFKETAGYPSMAISTTNNLTNAANFGGAAGKAAAASILEKSAIEVIRPYPKHKLTHFLPEQSRKSTLTLDEANSIAKAMDTAARYGALNDTQVQLNGAKLIGLQNRAVENKRNSAFTKWMAGMSDPFEGLPDKVQSVPDAYLPNHDTVWLPSGNPAIMMHELGHATDMNEFPNTPFRRFVAGTYQNYAPTLWKEHAAWIKGQNRLIEGAAKTKVDPNLIVRTLEDTARVKPTGLGSYWGAGLGALAGAGLGTAAFLGSNGNPGMIRAIPLGLILGTALGGITGLQAGKLLGGRESLGSDKAKQKYLEIYANQYAKEHGMTLDEAKIELNNLIKKKPKVISKAASFGSMMGKQAALDPAVANALGLGAAGLAGGGLLGALSGAVDPGYEDKEKRKRMSRLRAAIYGGLGGATLGGLGGAILGGGGTELMRVSPKIENWITGQKLKSQTDIPVDVVNDLKNKAVNFNVWAANRSYDDLGRDAHFEFMRKGMPKDQENWVEVFGKKVSPSWRSGPDWRINLNPGEPRATDNLFNQMGPTVVDNPFSRAANKATDMLSKLVSKKEK